MRTEIMMSCTPTGVLTEDGRPEFAYNFVVNAEPGPELFDMITDFLHKSPDYIADHFKLALQFNQEHDRENCQYCKEAELSRKPLSYKDWRSELIRVTARCTGVSERSIVLREVEAKEWYDSGATPYQCFRENWGNDGD